MTEHHPEIGLHAIELITILIRVCLLNAMNIQFFPLHFGASQRCLFDRQENQKIVELSLLLDS
jgi:hypothetical protein